MEYYNFFENFVKESMRGNIKEFKQPIMPKYITIKNPYAPTVQFISPH